MHPFRFSQKTKSCTVVFHIGFLSILLYWPNQFSLLGLNLVGKNSLASPIFQISRFQVVQFYATSGSWDHDGLPSALIALLSRWPLALWTFRLSPRPSSCVPLARFLTFSRRSGRGGLVLSTNFVCMMRLGFWRLRLRVFVNPFSGLHLLGLIVFYFRGSSVRA